ncbi:enoyl-CoA hydratase [Orrella sp. NBD-18]|uniref:Enoyl-CoA hydratase n=1 Tax=Sheuella amnicola TaxID=2707330 RepID=A0A6B2QYR1_9BURK|nr:enoyl-CoA hydratase-related protein [Sheuella amnicola]NDY83161.1 enoyl-CoA hydratase [Sheuella amnicola]
MTSQTVLTEISQGVLTLTINRPERRNAIDTATYLTLAEQVSSVDIKAIRAIVLTGANNYFTAGNDLKDFQAPRPEGDSAGLTFLRSLVNCDLPIVAAIEGSAIGIGVTMLQHCDFVYAADNANFKIPFVPLGLCPEGASSLLLAQIVGPRRATDWLLRGQPFTATEAYDAGFLTGLCRPGETLSHARKIAAELSALPPEALQLSKRMLKHSQRSKIHETFDYELGLFSQRLKSEEAQAAFAGFFKAKA